MKSSISWIVIAGSAFLISSITSAYAEDKEIDAFVDVNGDLLTIFETPQGDKYVEDQDGVQRGGTYGRGFTTGEIRGIEKAVDSGGGGSASNNEPRCSPSVC